MAATKTSRPTAGMVTVAILLAVPGIMVSEGKRNVTYYDVARVPTYCWGHADRSAKVGSYHNDTECAALLSADARKHAEGIAKCLPGSIPLETLAASIQLAFNIGIAAFCGSSAARLFRAGRFAAGCERFLPWDKVRGLRGKLVRSKGLTNRRIRERELCLKGIT